MQAHALARGRDAQERPPVRARHHDECRDPVPLREHLLRDDLHVREGVQEGGEQPAQPREGLLAALGAVREAMPDQIGGEELPELVQSPLDQGRVQEAAVEGGVLLRGHGVLLHDGLHPP